MTLGWNEDDSRKKKTARRFHVSFVSAFVHDFVANPLGERLDVGAEVAHERDAVPVELDPGEPSAADARIRFVLLFHHDAPFVT